MTKYNLALKQSLIEECLSASSVHEVALKHGLIAKYSQMPSLN